MIYLDNAATYMGNFGICNANSPYADKEKEALEKDREIIAKIIHCKPQEIYFTSGGCESNTWAIMGIAKAYKDKGNHIITTKIEHHSILNCCKALEEEGFEVTYLDVDIYGRVSVEALRNAITDQTILLSIGHVNNELGTIQSVRELSEEAHKNGILFHVDCVQSMGKLPINIDKMGVDLLSASGHKFSPTYGVGFLYKKENVKIKPLIFGGSQEQGLRGGTTNLPAINTMTSYLADAYTEASLDEKIDAGMLCLYLEDELKEISEDIRFNSPLNRLPMMTSVGFEGIDAEALMLFLQDHGIYLSSGSACSSGEKEISHVLKAIDLPEEYAKGTIRFSLSDITTREDIDKTVELIKQYIELTKE